MNRPTVAPDAVEVTKPLNERQNYMIELALGVGFVMTPPDADGNEYACTDINIVDMFQRCDSGTRRKVVQELRSSAFLHTDVNKEHVLLAIEHGTGWHKYVPEFAAADPIPPCNHEFHLNGTQTVRRCDLCDEYEAAPNEAASLAKAIRATDWAEGPSIGRHMLVKAALEIIDQEATRVVTLTDDQIVNIANECHAAMPEGADEQAEIILIVRECFAFQAGDQS